MLKFIIIFAGLKNLTIMMNKKLLFLLLGSSLLSAQTINESAAATKVSGKTGINTNIPTRTLTIQNTDTNQGKPVLRLVDTPKYSENINSAMDAALGGNTQSTTKHSDYRHLVVNSVGDVYQGIPMTNNTGVFTVVIKNVDQDFVSDFDTGIDHNKYTVTILSSTFHLPPEIGSKKSMLVTTGGMPDVKDGNNNSISKVAPPIVYLYKNGRGTWSIYADYPYMGVQRFDWNSNGYGTAVNGDWEIHLQIGKKELIHSGRAEFNQGGVSTGKGVDNATYRTRLNDFLQKLD